MWGMGCEECRVWGVGVEEEEWSVVGVWGVR